MEATGETYKHASHDPIAPWQALNALLLWQSEHDVEQRKEAG